MSTTNLHLQKKLADGLISSEELTSQANKLLADNKLSEAYPYVKTVAMLSTSSITDKMTAGILAVSLQKNSDAFEFFSEITKIEPLHYDANYNLALIEINSQNYENAYKRVETLLTKYPENSELLND